MEELKKILFNSDVTEQDRVRIIKLLQTIEELTGYGYYDLQTKSRKREKVMLRNMSCNLISLYTKLSLKQIGQIFGGRDHSTVIHSKEVHRNDIDTNDKYVKLYSKIKQNFIIEFMDAEDVALPDKFDKELLSKKGYEIQEHIDVTIKKLEDLRNFISTIL